MIRTVPIWNSSACRQFSRYAIRPNPRFILFLLGKFTERMIFLVLIDFPKSPQWLGFSQSKSMECGASSRSQNLCRSQGFRSAGSFGKRGLLRLKVLPIGSKWMEHLHLDHFNTSWTMSKKKKAAILVSGMGDIPK